jgi:hypothetical protein
MMMPDRSRLLHDEWRSSAVAAARNSPQLIVSRRIFHVALHKEI